ncbi:MAG: heavy metal translocating P-type ATPase [Candidatus Nitrosocosmicus sp.]
MQQEKQNTDIRSLLLIKKIFLFGKQYPLPIIAILGLLFGTIINYVFYTSSIGYWIWFIILLIGGTPIIFQTLKDMIRGHFASDIVAMLAIITAIITNEAFPGIIIVIIQSGGKALEDYAFRKATTSLDDLMARSPKIAHRKRNKHDIEDLSVEDVQVNDLLIIRPGDLIPVDGTILSSKAQIDESALTGEPLFKTKYKGEEVYSGTVNTGDIFEIYAKKTSNESQYSKIVQLVQKARDEKAPIQRLADRYAKWFTLITLAMCGFGWLLTHNFQTILSILVVATPCPLIFATPVAIISGINKAAKQNIIVKSGSAIEQLGKTDVIVFDKTGTITYGTPLVENIIPTDNNNNIKTRDKKKETDFNTLDDLLFKSSSLEQMSSHPAAQALAKIGKEKFNHLLTPKNFHEKAGLGVEGYLNGDHIKIGSYNFIKSYKNENNSDDNEFNEYLLETMKNKQKQGKMVSFININNKNVGIIVFSDKIREEVHNMMQLLKKQNIKQTIMLTGDSIDNAKSIANLANIDNYKYDLLPEDKVNEINRLKKQYKNIVMVGDGINDAPALTSATTGIAMGAKGTAISAEAADVVLLVDDITKVYEIIQISKRTIKIAKESIFIGLGISFFLMIVASFGFIPPYIGALLQEVIDVGVILNALRAR